MQNKYFIVGFDIATGMLTSIHHKASEITTRTETQFMMYSTRTTSEKSGAYLFLPDDIARPFRFNAAPKLFISQGPLVEELQVHLPEVIHKVRLVKADVSIGWWFGPRGKRGVEMNQSRRFFWEFNGYFFFLL